MPFMLYPTPLLAFFLVMVGFSDEISSFVRRVSPNLATLIAHFFATVLPDIHKLSPSAQLAIGMTGVMLVLFKFFDLFPQCVYYYLFADVIPQEVMGTFVCLFRLMATLGAVVFHYWLLQYADSHPKATYIACGMLYLLAFSLLSLLVKEGDYPPPPPRKKVLPAIFAWFRESFSIPFYWNYFLCYGCFRWAYIPFNLFLILFAQNKLHMNPEKFGHVMALVLVVQLPVLLLLGPVLDRFHPVRVGVAGFLLMAASGTAAFVSVRSTATFLIFSIGVFVAIAVCQSALSTMSPRLLWRERYGQFCAAAAMVAESGLLVLSGVCGVILDRWGEQFVYLWVTIFSLLGCVLTFVLFRAWKQRGGDVNYVAPILEELATLN
jgi:maltose/moltooligosaccharide transporter